MIKRMLGAAVALVLIHTLPASAAESGDKWNAAELQRKAQAEKVFAQIRSRLRAEVREITLQEDGTSRILFHAIGRLGQEEDGDKIMEKLSQGYTLQWTERDRPLPWIVRQQVDLGVKGAEIIYVGMGTMMPQFFRHASNGEVELLVRDEKQRPFLVRPHKLGSMDDYGIGFDWLKGMGVVMTNYEAGEGDFEVEGSSRRGAGIAPLNAPERRIQLGRDGWRTIKSVQPEGDPKEGYIGHYRTLVPATQRIWCAG